MGSIDNSAPHRAEGEYFPHIDGIRALAVVPVMLFHVLERICPGGFVGVDVFFVISGYLITGGILRDLENRRFTIPGFYHRRIRRIMPAYLRSSPVSLSPDASFIMRRRWSILATPSRPARCSWRISTFDWRSATISVKTSVRSPCCTSGRWVSRNNSISSSLCFAARSGGSADAC